MVASDVDEGLPLRVGEVYAPLALCCRNQVTYATIVLGARPRPCRRGGTAKGDTDRTRVNKLLETTARLDRRSRPGLYTHPRRKVFAEEEHHAQDQSVAEMANEVLMRQAKARAEWPGRQSKKRWRPFWTPRLASNSWNSGTVPTAKRPSKRRK